MKAWKISSMGSFVANETFFLWKRGFGWHEKDQLRVSETMLKSDKFFYKFGY